MIRLWKNIPDEPFANATILLAFKPFAVGFMVADALAISGKAMSVPSLLALEDADAFFLDRAFGSNLPA